MFAEGPVPATIVPTVGKAGALFALKKPKGHRGFPASARRLNLVS